MDGGAAAFLGFGILDWRCWRLGKEDGREGGGGGLGLVRLQKSDV